MPATPFEGHASWSVAKNVYDHPESVAPADRLYAADGSDAGTAPDVYDPSAYANEPGAAARAKGYPRA